MAAPINRPPEVTHHAPTHPGADHHNAVLAAARARVDELEPKLAAVLEPILGRAGDEAARRFRKYATNHLTAAGPLTGVQPTSTMICVRPRPEEAAAIADPDGAPASDLHCTLAFLGEIEGPLDSIREALAPVAGQHGPLAGVVAGYGEFRPPDVGILLPDVPGLVELRCAVTEALVQAGIDYSRDHGFQPHITIDGDPEDDEIEEMLDRASGRPLHFDALLIVRGDAETFELPLVGPRPLTADGQPPPPDWTAPAGDELVDTDALAAQLRGKTDPIRLALIQDVLGPSIAAAGLVLNFDVDNPLIDGLIAKTGQHITGIADTTQANVMRAIGSSYKEGLSIPDTAKVITQVMHEAAGPRAIMIARCLPGETLIDGAVVRAVTRRWYEGDMAVVRTEAGREFTATPNHPMFTAQGWRGLGELKEGDDLVCYRRDEDAGAAGDEDVDDGPPSLVEIFEAATAVGVVERRTGGEPDFHGDGREGEVDIARPHRELALGYMPVLHQESVEGVLAPSVVTDGALFCSGCGHLLAVEKERCLCGVPSPGPALADDATDQTAGDVECSGEGVDALARMETREYLPLREVVPSRGRLAPVREVVGAGLTEAAAGNTLDSEPFEDGALVHPGTLRDSGRAQAREIELDRVVSVHRAPFIGFVYNLCTPYGYFTVNGGYTGNTEMTSAVNGASLAAAQVIGQATGKTMTKTWLTAPGARYPRHEDYEDLDGQTVKQDETFTVGEDELQYPGDPDGDAGEVINCFPGSTRVVVSEANVGFRRRYVGNLVRVETERGNALSGTPNHPVLTDAGWKPLHLLREGDNLVCGRLREVAAVADPDVDHTPTAIQQVVAALARVDVSHRVRGGAVQFHGDPSADGEVEVVTADRELRMHRDAVFADPTPESRLMWADEVAGPLAAARSAREVVLAAAPAPDSVVRGRGESLPLLGRSLPHPLPHGGGTATRLDTEFEEVAPDHFAVDAVALGQGLLGDAFEVSLAKVVAVKIDAFHGEVFNLQTQSGAYLAEGIIAHNCRCAMTFSDGSEVEAE